MVVTATCQDCGDEHPLGDRRLNGGLTSECPNCHSESYITDGSRTVSKSEHQRITDAIKSVDGVGDETLQNVCAAFDLYAELTSADIAELCEIDMVGRATAERICAHVAQT